MVTNELAILPSIPCVAAPHSKSLHIYELIQRFGNPLDNMCNAYLYVMTLISISSSGNDIEHYMTSVICHHHMHHMHPCMLSW